MFLQKKTPKMQRPRCNAIFLNNLCLKSLLQRLNLRTTFDSSQSPTAKLVLPFQSTLSTNIWVWIWVWVGIGLSRWYSTAWLLGLRLARFMVNVGVRILAIN